MYQNYKVVVNTAAGRRRYMQYLVPPILNADIVDRYDIWVNTRNMVDIEFFKKLAQKYPKVNLVWQPDGVVNGIASINAFYRDCCDKDTIYMKLDDDVVWFEPELFEKMVKFRVDNPEYFLVSPLVINNALSTYLLQVHNKIKLDKYYMSICGSWRNILLPVNIKSCMLVSILWGWLVFQSTVFYGLVMKWLNLKVKCQEMMKSF